ncbi:O-acetyl-ADP-ribose deacetylase [bacterium HR26]|nr:O-acetyl-ADP-ribose deacetylase [bacterium HR26]
MGSGILEVVIGDITTVDTEAIVNAANNELWMGSGVAGAIKRAGGEEIEREAVSKGPIRIGEAVATGAGRLPYKAVIHAAAMGYQGGRMIPPTAESIQAATRAALEVADQLGFESVAFPALGTGVGGFDLAEAATLMVSTVHRSLSRPDSRVRRVVFVVRDEEARRAFQEAIERATAT